MSSTHHSRLRVPVLALAATSLLAAGCGSDDDDTTAATTAAAPASSVAPTTASDAPSVTTAAGGGSIKIGVANNESAALSLPEYRHGIEAAVAIINANGGVNGANLEIDTCISDASPEGSINCANTFVDGDAVAYFSGIDVGADAALAILATAGIPYVTTEPWGAQQKVDPNSTVFGAAQGAYTFGPLQALADRGVKKVGAFFTDLPSTRDLVQAVIEPAAVELGLEVVTVYVQATNPDWASAVTAAMAQNVDAMWGIMTEPDCIASVQAARAAGFTGTFAVGSCTAYIGVLGDLAVNTITVSDTWLPELRADAPKNIQEHLDVYTEAMTDAGFAEELNGFAVQAFASTMDLAEVMRGIDGPVTASSLTEALESATAVPGFMRGDATCRTDMWPSEPSVCRASLLVLDVVAGTDGPVRQASSGEMVDLTPFAA